MLAPKWDQMLAPLNEVGDSQSRILVTTRTQKLASKLVTENVVVELKDLEYEHCMSIFKYYSFGDANKVIHDPEIATIAEQIMEKLKKSPLSARMVGSALREENVAVWKRILEKDEILKGDLDVLYLSFNKLAPHLQRCFAFCSLYLKGYHFDEVDDLVKLWIAQGFVEAPKEDKMTMEDIGMEYFDELVSNSFFQKETTSYEEDNFVIHDLLHDLAEEVSKGHCFRIEDDSKDIPPTTVRHLSIWTEDLLTRRSHLCMLENLRTFMITDRIPRKVDFDRIIDGRSKMFEKFKKLRVLHFGDSRSSELLKSIGKFKHLRSLQVYRVKRLPESLGRLYHLQFLNLEGCYFIDEVPKKLNNLINLRFLHTNSEIFSKIPFFRKLVSLQSIELYNVSRKKGHGIGQLKNLRHLRGSLCINKLENVQSKAEASEASLKEKILLEELTLAWTYSQERDGKIDEEVIKGLEPPPNLNVLGIEGYNDIELNPEWLLDDGCFLRLSKLTIKNCGKLERVPSLPSTLKRLLVSECENLNEIPSLPSGLRKVTVINCPKLMQLSPYPPNLEELIIEGCHGVETLLWNILLFEGEDEQTSNQQQKQKEEDNPQQQQHFSLKTLHIERCSVLGKKRLLSNPNNLCTSLTILELKELPWLTSLFHPDQKLKSLEVIDIWECENMVELFGSPLASSPLLRCLIIRNCPRLVMQPDMDGSFLLPSPLATLAFCNCGDPEMNLLGRCLIGLASLKCLFIGGCSRARSLPDLANPGALTQLSISDCPELTSLWNLQPFSSLQDLRVTGCPKLITIGVGERLPPPSLKYITIDHLSLLTALLLPQGEFPISLRSLTIQSCTALFTEEQVEESFRGLSSLRELRIEGCPNLTSLPASMMEKLSSLKMLDIRQCPTIELLPDLPASLEHLGISGCHPQLQARYGKDGPLRHKVQHIRYVSIS